MVIKAMARNAPQRCSYCHGEYLDGFVCSCGASYHVDCAKHIGKCVIIGCYNSTSPKLYRKTAKPKARTSSDEGFVTFLHCVLVAVFLSLVVAGSIYFIANIGFFAFFCSITVIYLIILAMLL